ncbi:MAG: hypothetical protein AAB787_00030 [Patescibacteria group bacterium]
MAIKKKKKVSPKKRVVKKKVAKRAVKKKAVKKKLVLAKVKREKPIGEVTHFFGKIKVAIVKFKAPVKVGAEVWFKGATTDFSQVIQSMQFDHKPVSVAKKDKEIGIKVKKQVREGDLVFKSG